MKKYWKLIIAAVAFVAFMVVVSVAYKNLSQEYKPQQNLVTQNGAGKEDDSVSESAGASDTDNSASDENKTPDGDGAQGQEVADGESAIADGQEKNGDGQSTAGVDQEASGGNATSDGQSTAGEDAENTENLAPNFTVETADGEEVSLHDFFGKPIVLNFWASWCGPCKMELPDFQEAYEKYAGEIEFVMVNMTDGVQETKEIAIEFMEGEGYTLPVYYDTAQDAAYTYTVYSLPTTFFISAEGEPVAYAQGMIDAETLEKGISMIYP